MNKLVILAIIVALAACDPQAPIYPDQWQQNFVDHWEKDGEKIQTNGYWVYDWENGKQNQWRDNCQADSVAGFFKEPTACSQLVYEDKRYVYAPSKNFCCYVCSAREGCGLLRPNWVRLSHAKWDGYKLIDDQFYNVFKNIDGSSPVYTLFNAESEIQSYIYRPGNKQLMVFDQDSFTSYIQNPNLLEFPSICQDAPDCP